MAAQSILPPRVVILKLASRSGYGWWPQEPCPTHVSQIQILLPVQIAYRDSPVPLAL